MTGTARGKEEEEEECYVIKNKTIFFLAFSNYRWLQYIWCALLCNTRLAKLLLRHHIDTLHIYIISLFAKLSSRNAGDALWHDRTVDVVPYLFDAVAVEGV